MKTQLMLFAFLGILLLASCDTQQSSEGTQDSKELKEETIANKETSQAQPGEASDQVKKLAEQASSTFGTILEKMPGNETDSSDMVALGEKLYNEKLLSTNDTISCNSCHRLDENKTGVDNLPTSPGAHGEPGKRNSPTVLNAGFQIAQFWDGRAADLVEQAKGSVLNPVEMAMPDEATVVEKLTRALDYQEMFKKTFPEDENPLTYHNVTRAIASFERTLITQDRFDDFQKGQHDALNPEEQKGLALFIKSECITCHNGPVLGGNSYQKVGLVHPYENIEDLGRFSVTKQEADKYVFKVPVLRNIVLTGPYFHNGKVATLDEAVKLMAWLQLGKELTDEEVHNIVKFLHSLSDKKRAVS